jgi:hypothetical protein
MRSFTAALLTASLATSLAGCAFDSETTAEGTTVEQRTITRDDGTLRVSVVVLSAEESATLYGVPLADKRIQPVRVEVENRDDRAYWLLSPGLDPNFFPASEAAEAFAADRSAEDNAAVTQRFQNLAFRNPVPPGTAKSGHLLANLDEGVKLVQLDLVASGRLRTFSVLAEVPGFRADYEAREVFERDIYPPDQVVDYTDDDAFRGALEALPCCVSNEDASNTGDPLNLVIVGGSEDAFPALVRRGWRPTEATWSGSVWKMMTSALSRERYAYAPVSDLYLYSRPQDLALQKGRDTIHQRNHLRLWLAPIRYQGKQVWVGQISRDIGSRMTIHSPTLTTHKIDPDVDEARNALIEDLAYSQSLAKIGLVHGVGAAPRSAPRENLTTDPYFTDGRRAVLIFERKPTSLAAIQLLPWAPVSGGMVEQATQPVPP